MTGPHVPEDATAAVREARRLLSRSAEQALRVIERRLRDYERELRLALAKGRSPRAEVSRLLAVLNDVKAAHDTLAKRLVALTSSGRTALLRDILRVWGGNPATLEPILAASLFETARGVSWIASLRTAARGAEAEISLLVADAITHGVSGEALARAILPYVRGASVLKRVSSPNHNWDFDLRRIPPELREAGRRLRFEARRIALSELAIARHEAEILVFRSDPSIASVRWMLSSNRGKTRIPDACDMLATMNAYALGKGIYPVTKVPALPHPFCRCSLVPLPGTRRPTTRREFFLPKGVGFAEVTGVRRDIVIRQVHDALGWGDPPTA